MCWKWGSLPLIQGLSSFLTGMFFSESLDWVSPLILRDQKSMQLHSPCLDGVQFTLSWGGEGTLNCLFPGYPYCTSPSCSRVSVAFLNPGCLGLPSTQCRIRFKKQSISVKHYHLRKPLGANSHGSINLGTKISGQ